MGEYVNPNHPIERRSEPRKLTDRFYSVQFTIEGLGYIYQFKLRDISTKGICILVKGDSKLLNHIQVGNIVDMKYHPTEITEAIEQLKTEIKHITKYEQGRFKGHSLVGLQILSKNSIQDTK
jgi:hypothetical protein